jgi:hypothetical protein
MYVCVCVCVWPALGGLGLYGNVPARRAAAPSRIFPLLTRELTLLFVPYGRVYVRESV